MTNIADLKKLRTETGVSIALCKKALDEAGNIEGAKSLLSSWGESLAGKKSGRQTAEGVIVSYVHHNGKIGVLLSLLCETDFVAKNQDFLDLAKELSLQIASTDPDDTKSLLDQEYIKDPSKKISQLIQGLIVKIGENIKIGEFKRFEI